MYLAISRIQKEGKKMLNSKMNYVQRSENLMRMFLAGMSYRDHSKTVADNGFFRFMTQCPTVGSKVKNHQKKLRNS